MGEIGGITANRTILHIGEGSKVARVSSKCLTRQNSVRRAVRAEANSWQRVVMAGATTS
jgi:hypothetical protein